MRRISANIIITNTGAPLKNGIIELDENNVIQNVVDTGGKLQESENLEFYNGIIVPGFVNAHCHLELSHMKGMLTKGKKLPSFIREIIATRFNPDNLEEVIELADKQMQLQGIVACGDISNTNDTIPTKKKSPIYYHTFAEVFTIGAEKPETAFDRGTKLVAELINEDLAGTVVPHAPYSVPTELYKKIASQKFDSDKILSVHNQETESENELFYTKKGELHEVLSYKEVGYKGFDFGGKNSLQTTLNYLPIDSNILLIHNSFSEKEDIEFAEEYSPNIYWTLCPRSNMYIENRTPDFSRFFDKNIKICIGTDSLASNDSLSILEELKLIQQQNSEISLEKLIFAATQQGANALKISDSIGSLEIGKKPGLNLLTGTDLQNMKLSENSGVKVIV